MNEIKNLLIGLVIVILVGLGVWYFFGRPAEQTSMPAGQMENMMTAPEVATGEETRCPVTGEKVDPAKTTLKTVYKGKTYYFCCPGCPEEFKKNPEKFIKK